MSTKRTTLAARAKRTRARRAREQKRKVQPAAASSGNVSGPGDAGLPVTRETPAPACKVCDDTGIIQLTAPVGVPGHRCPCGAGGPEVDLQIAKMATAGVLRPGGGVPGAETSTRPAGEPARDPSFLRDVATLEEWKDLSSKSAPTFLTQNEQAQQDYYESHPMKLENVPVELRKIPTQEEFMVEAPVGRPAPAPQVETPMVVVTNREKILWIIGGLAVAGWVAWLFWWR